MIRLIISSTALAILVMLNVAAAETTDLLKGAYNPENTLAEAVVTETSDMLVLLEYGRIELHHGWYCQLPAADGTTLAPHGMLIGNMTLTLDSLPPDTDDHYNLFDAMHPGKDVVLHPVELYFYAARNSPLRIESQGVLDAAMEFPDAPEELQQQFTGLYMESYSDGWWEDPADILEQMDSGDYNTIAEPVFGKLGIPVEKQRYIRWIDNAGEVWEIDTEHADFDLRRGRYYEFSFIGSSPRMPFFLEDRKRYSTIISTEWNIVIQHKQASPLSWGSLSRTETLKFTFQMDETRDYLDVDFALFREDIEVTDGEGNSLEWEEVKLPTSISGIRVHGMFEQGREYSISLRSKYDNVVNSLGDENILEFTLRPNTNGYQTNPPLTIHISLPEDLNYKYTTASGATTIVEDGVFSASWPAGSFCPGVIAHLYGQGSFQSDYYLIRYIVPEELLDTPEVLNSVVGLALWLDFNVELFGPLPVDEWTAIIDPARDTDSVRNPIDARLQLADSPLGTQYSGSRLWQFQSDMFDTGTAWFFREPEYWHNALNSYRYFAATREYSDFEGVKNPDEEREMSYYTHLYRYFPGTHEQVTEWRVDSDRIPEYRIPAALLAMDYKSRDELWAALKQLYQQGLETGHLEFEEISAAFLNHENPEFGGIWQSIVLDGDMPEYVTELDNFSLPGITPSRADRLLRTYISRNGFSAEIHGNPYAARHWYLLLGDDIHTPRLAYWQAENCYLYGEPDRALKFLDIVDGDYESGDPRLPDRFILRVLCLKELGRTSEALDVAEHGAQLLGNSESDHLSALVKLRNELQQQSSAASP